MKLFTQQPLRITVPLFLLVLVIITSGFSMIYTRHFADKNEEENALEFVAQNMSELQGTLIREIRSEHWEHVQIEIANKGSNHNIALL